MCANWDIDYFVAYLASKPRRQNATLVQDTGLHAVLEEQGKAE